MLISEQSHLRFLIQPPPEIVDSLCPWSSIGCIGNEPLPGHAASHVAVSASAASSLPLQPLLPEMCVGKPDPVAEDDGEVAGVTDGHEEPQAEVMESESERERTPLPRLSAARAVCLHPDTLLPITAPGEVQRHVALLIPPSRHGAQWSKTSDRVVCKASPSHFILASHACALAVAQVMGAPASLCVPPSRARAFLTAARVSAVHKGGTC
jgi:hypothetical protein